MEGNWRVTSTNIELTMSLNIVTVKRLVNSIRLYLSDYWMYQNVILDAHN